MLEKPKRKGLPRRRYFVAIGITIVCLVLAVGVYQWLYAPYATYPYDIIYNAEGTLYQLDLATDTTYPIGNGSNDLNYITYATAPNGYYLATWVFTGATTGRGTWDLSVAHTDNFARRVYHQEFHIGYGTISWSPDSKYIALAHIPDGGDEELAIVNITSGELMQLTDNDYRDDSPHWSPDGSQLVYTSAADGYNRLYVYDFASQKSTLLTDKAFGYMPKWSPDGNMIAFMSNHESYNGDVYLIGTDGTALRRVTYHEKMILNLEWMK